MNDKTHDILNRLKEYFDSTEITTEGFDDVSRIALMAVAKMGQLSAFLAPTDSASRLVDANFQAINGLYKISQIVGTKDNVIKMPLTNQTPE